MLALQCSDGLNVRFSRCVRACLFVIAYLAIGSVVKAEANDQEGTSSREAREHAARSVPYQSLTQEAANKLRSVIEDPTIFRRMPTQPVTADPDFFNFLVRYPEVLVEIWQEMGVTRVETNRTGSFAFAAVDGAGTTCKNELILGSDRLHIYYSEGFYEGGLTARKLEGRCVCIVYGQGSVAENTHSIVMTHMDVFLKLDNVGADLIAKTISPLVVRTADYNYTETLRFVSQLATAAQRDPEAVERLSTKLDGLQPDVRNKFIQVSNQAALRRDRLIAAHWQQQIETEQAESQVAGQSPPYRAQAVKPTPPSSSTSDVVPTARTNR